jgi:hypothetical protein
MAAANRKRRATANGFQPKHGLYLAGCVALILISAYIANALSHESPWHGQPLEEDRAKAEFETTRVGTIVMNSPGTRCQRFSFDNETGLTTPDFRPCDIDYDARGAPGPNRSIRRLDAISKSFLSK